MNDQQVTRITLARAHGRAPTWLQQHALDAANLFSVSWEVDMLADYYRRVLEEAGSISVHMRVRYPVIRRRDTWARWSVIPLRQWGLPLEIAREIARLCSLSQRCFTFDREYHFVEECPGCGILRCVWCELSFTLRRPGCQCRQSPRLRQGRLRRVRLLCEPHLYE